MLSMPPATTYLKSPQRRSLAAIIAARIPEPQTLLRVMAPVAAGQPAASAAWRAGACPWPAGRTQPMLTCSISSGVRPARSMAAAIARAPRACAERLASAPWKTPIGVRTALKITTSSMTSPVKRLRGSGGPYRRGPPAGRPILARAPPPTTIQCARTGSTMRFLGIDFGEKRIGLAISDPAGRLAVPLATLERRNDRSALRQIAEIARNEGIERLVLGEPVDLYGNRGPVADAGARLRRAPGRDDRAPRRVGGRGADQRRGGRAAAPGRGRHPARAGAGSTRSPRRSCCRTPSTGSRTGNTDEHGLTRTSTDPGKDRVSAVRGRSVIVRVGP